jgi:hypothetical protein
MPQPSRAKEKFQEGGGFTTEKDPLKKETVQDLPFLN